MSVNGILNALCIASGILFASKLCSSVAGVVSDEDCLSRGRNCTWCLSDGNCGFCDRCGDHCHKPGAIHSLENCTNCASCIPGNLAGSKNKGHECRAEWYYYEKCPEVISEQKTVYVEIALYLINLHSVDLKAGTFHADFYLYFKVPEGQTMYTKQKCHDGLKGACFELVNAAGQAEVSSHEGKYFRVKSAFNFAADLQDYPYDNQTLKIVIQDMEMTAKELRWKVMKPADFSDFKFRGGVSPTLNYTGWLFDTNSWSQMVYERYNPFLDQGVSRYEFLFHMRRHKRAAFFKIFLPPLFIALVVCFSFSIPPNDASMRLWIDGSLLVSAVMFHASVSEQTPDTPELTLADRFMVGVYSFIFASFIVTIVMLRLQRENYYYLADIFYSYTEWLVWFTAPTFFFFLYYMNLSLYHVLLYELLAAFLSLTLNKFFSRLKSRLFRLLKFDRLADTSCKSPMDETVACNSRNDGYFQLTQDEETELSLRSAACKPCFPGNRDNSCETPCPKQQPTPNKKA
ncbi:proton-gated ion channel-like [Porites lutea]|uniref:proton-gated ion channel-like n=1 Tax=Porites lutea TaxID=51062 RepID=UPI003CC56E17